MADSWWIRAGNGPVQGPFSGERVARYIRDGIVRPEMSFSADKRIWKLGSELPSLFPPTAPRAHQAPVVEQPEEIPSAEPIREKECPECAEVIKAQAKVCRFCGFDLLGRTRRDRLHGARTRAPPVQVMATVQSPGVAVVLSFLYAGLGQLYTGQIAKGLVLMIVWPLLIFMAIWGAAIAFDRPSTVLAVVIVCAVVSFVIWVWQLVDAYQAADRINQRVRHPRPRRPARYRRSRRGY